MGNGCYLCDFIRPKGKIFVYLSLNAIKYKIIVKIFGYSKNSSYLCSVN